MLSMRLQRKKRNQVREIEKEKENDQQNNVETFCLAKVC